MKNLNSKSADLVKSIARELMTCKVGTKIPTTPQLAAKFSVGFGTVDKAMSVLKETGAIKLQSKGQLGTLLLEKDMSALWVMTEQGPLVGSSPLPNTIEFQGLASGLIEMFMEQGITCSLTYKNGGTIRVKQLLGGQCDFVIMSHMSAVQVCAEHPHLRIVSIMENNSYYMDLIILRRKDVTSDITEWRIGFDPTSYDHITLSDEIFSGNEKTNVHYGNIPYLIADGVIDAAIWHSTQLVPTALIDILAVQQVETPRTENEKNMAAAFVVDGAREDIIALFEDQCDAGRIGKIQQEVITRKRSPAY
ncbi:YhfZ family protein [Bacillus sp. FJAT-28004]|uniref:YhfZ family protein n=1 Tax=Bacillus sp. FJAT-28004 TaxID=1679165 RepID=UPI0006B420FC|nr:YhfZ family protein [Bacillus sp. FJAT-28004]